ncbi:MAG: hypothetical protein ACRDDY_03665 [Clostridium sp.]|uniref:hypothetical protein n=1 Tax=Clostridium sp. TaxID=1506 RepID=UPI003EE683EB
MKKDFMVVKVNFDDDIKFPYKRKIVDITGKEWDEVNIIIDKIVKELNESKEYHKEDEWRGRFLDKCIGGINYLCRECNDLSIMSGNWDLELLFELEVEVEEGCVYINR